MNNIDSLRHQGNITSNTPLNFQQRRLYNLDFIEYALRKQELQDILIVAGQGNRVVLADSGQDLAKFIYNFIDDKNHQFLPILFKQHDINNNLSHKSCLVLLRDNDEIKLIISDSGSAKSVIKLPEFNQIIQDRFITDNMAKIYINAHARLIDIGCSGFALRDCIYYSRRGFEETKIILESFENNLKISQQELQSPDGLAQQKIIFYDFVEELMYDSQFTKDHENQDRSISKYIARNSDHLSTSQIDNLERIANKKFNSDNDIYVQKIYDILSDIHSNPFSQSYQLYSKGGVYRYKTPSTEIIEGRDFKIKQLTNQK